MNKFELRLKYKNETSSIPDPITVYARVGKFGDVILDQTDCDERVFAMFKENSNGGDYISFPDPDYQRWLEEKLMELL